jgi:uncharacterized protein
MVVDLREFDDFPVTVMLEAAPGEITSIAPEVTQVERVTFLLSIQKSGEEYFCQGTAQATVTMDCSRCAGSFQTDLSESTDFIIRSDAGPADSGTNVVDSEDYVFLHGHDAVADVTEMVRQTLVLAVDLKPLCREDCKGLCPVCGTNLNERTCHCERNNSDGRWDGLKGLLQS